MIIQKTEIKDLENIRNLRANGDVMKYVGFPDGYETTPEAMEAWLQRIDNSDQSQHYSIYHEAAYCGEVFYRLIENNEAKIDIKLMPHCWGKGMGQDCLSFIVDEVLHTTPATTCRVDPHPDNTAAIRCYLGAGFVKAEHEDNVYKVSWETFKPTQKHLKSVLQLKPISTTDSERLWHLVAKEPDYAWAHYNAPYFNEFEQMSYALFLEKEASFYLEKESVSGIYYRDTLIGMCSYYWECKQTRWMETGFVIYDERYWSKGIATLTARRHFSQCFASFDMNRIGFTTWSGNPGMIKVGRKLGMREEKCVRNARYYQNTDYDSIGYGITRDEWNSLQNEDYSYQYIKSPAQRESLCRVILESLPEWFGLPESIDEYCRDVRDMVCLVVYDESTPIAFMALSQPLETVVEIHVMGISHQYHRKGIGRRLFLMAQQFAGQHGCAYLMVKTLEQSHPDTYYQKTRLFYEAMGFVGIGVDRVIWGENTPCLTLIKHIDH